MNKKIIKSNKCFRLTDVMDEGLANIISENFDDICGFHQVIEIKKKFLQCPNKYRIPYKHTNCVNLNIDDEKVEQEYIIYYIDERCIKEYDDSDNENDVLSDGDTSDEELFQELGIVDSKKEPEKPVLTKKGLPKKVRKRKEKIDPDYNIFQDYKFNFYLFCREVKEDEDTEISTETCRVYGMLKSRKRKEIYFIKMMNICLNDNRIISDLISVMNLRLDQEK